MSLISQAVESEADGRGTGTEEHIKAWVHFERGEKMWPPSACPFAVCLKSCWPLTSPSSSKWSGGAGGEEGDQETPFQKGRTMLLSDWCNVRKDLDSRKVVLHTNPHTWTGRGVTWPVRRPVKMVRYDCTEEETEYYFRVIFYNFV